MTKSLPQPFPEPAPAAIATYDAIDVADGTGTIIFQGYSSGVVEDHHLSRSIVYSDKVETTKTDDLNLNFDTSLINLPRTIAKGTGLVSLSTVLNSNGGSVGAGSIYSNIFLIHVDKSNNPTTLASASGPFSSTETTSLVPLVIANEQYFKKGEKLRLNIHLVVPVAVSGLKLTLAHDPKDRDGTKLIPSSDTSSTTTLQAHIPFKLTDLN